MSGNCTFTHAQNVSSNGILSITRRQDSESSVKFYPIRNLANPDIEGGEDMKHEFLAVKKVGGYPDLQLDIKELREWLLRGG